MMLCHFETGLLTVLKDPPDHYLSWYYFARNQSAPGQSPEVQAAQECRVRDFFCLDRATIFRNIFNRQVRQLHPVRGRRAGAAMGAATVHFLDQINALSLPDDPDCKVVSSR